MDIRKSSHHGAECNNSYSSQTSIDFNDYLKKDIGASLDLSKHEISSIPENFLTKCVNLQYLYLEGNQLEELNNKLFPLLRQLKWLDVRNNKLKRIPSSIVDHPSLQTLLLEENEIKSLPVEIGSVETLRGLQLAGNPLIYPPPEVVNQGVRATLDFLRKQWLQLQSPTQIQLISETHSKTTVTTKSQPPCRDLDLRVHSHEPRRPRRTVSSLTAASLSQCIRVRPLSKERTSPTPYDTARRHHSDKFMVSVNSGRTNQKERRKRAPSYHRQSIKKISEEVPQKLVRDLWVEKIRQILLKQEAILQRRKSAEALKQWQDDTKSFQLTHSKKGSNADLKFPYGTHPDYVKMISRRDLVLGRDQRRNSSVHHIRHEEPMSDKISAILSALQQLKTSQSATAAGVTPRTEQKMLAQEIKKIKEIQRSLNALKLKNFGQLDLS